MLPVLAARRRPSWLKKTALFESIGTESLEEQWNKRVDGSQCLILQLFIIFITAAAAAAAAATTTTKIIIIKIT